MTRLLIDLAAGIPLAIWLYLLTGRGFFWLAAERDRPTPPLTSAAARVVAVIPARNEAETIGITVGSLLAQDYPGTLEIILVDDQSDDGTADLARQAAEGRNRRLTVVAGATPPNGWTGKLWALRQGIDRAMVSRPDFLLFIDADIQVSPDTVTSLVARAETGGFVLVSLMAKLRCVSLAERWLIPAFIFFFQMLYPFRWINRGDRRTAGAAGGCMLLRPAALEAAGGIAAIRGALIDDCSLGAAMKGQGPIWLGLTDRVHSIRRYDGFGEIRRMVARSAYAQLRYSPLLLAGCVVGMCVTYLAGPGFALFSTGTSQFLGFASWAAMAVAFQPLLRFYRVSPFYGLALPLIALVYLAFTLDSAYQHMRGRGGLWKGRVQAQLENR